MKRLLTLALCLAMLAVWAVPASASNASIPFDLDLTDVIEDSGFFQPGKVYYIPLRNDYGRQIEKGEYSQWRLSVKVEVDDDSKSSSRGGASVSLVYLDDNQRYVRFSTSSSAATGGDVVYKITLTARDTYTSSGSNIVEGYIETTVDVGYGSRGFISSSTYEVNDNEPIVDVSDDINECLITFPDGSRFNMMLTANSTKNKDNGIYRVVNLSTTTTPTTAVLNALSGYDYDYLGFSAATTFREGSQLRIYAPNRTHLYEVTGTGGLTKLSFTRAGNFMVFNTKKLGNYVMASGDLPTSGTSTGTSTGTTTGSTTGTTTATGSALSAATAGTAADNAVAAGNTTVRFSGIASVPLDAIKAVSSRSSIATAYFDTLDTNGGIQTRLYVKPGQATKAFTASTSLSSTGVASVKATFNSFFSNKVAVLELGHVGEFGMSVEVATKLSLSGMDTTKLYFYSYDKATNNYTAITSPNYWIDGSGYLHFTTTLGNYIVVSEGALAK